MAHPVLACGRCRNGSTRSALRRAGCAPRHRGRHRPAATARRCRATKTLTFATTTAELTALGDWLVAERVELVGMESTGVYWKPVYFLLEERIARVWLLNAEHLHNVPGRKTDVADSAWIAQLLEHGLVAPSFVPPAPIRVLRDYTRLSEDLIRERTRYWQRLEKLLEDAAIKVSAVASKLEDRCWTQVASHLDYLAEFLSAQPVE